MRLGLSLGLGNQALAGGASGPVTQTEVYGALSVFTTNAATTGAANGIAIRGSATAIVSGNAAGHFAISAGYISITSAGDTANLSGSPYSLVLDNGDTINITALANTYSIRNQTEWQARAVAPGAGNTLQLRSGVQIAMGMTGAASTPLRRLTGAAVTITSDDYARIQAAAWTGGAWPSTGAGGPVGALTGLAGFTDTNLQSTNAALTFRGVAFHALAYPTALTRITLAGTVGNPCNTHIFEWCIFKGTPIADADIIDATAPPNARFKRGQAGLLAATSSITGNVLTVAGSVPAGTQTIAVGDTIYTAAGVNCGNVTSFGTGVGGTGTYNLDVTQVTPITGTTLCVSGPFHYPVGNYCIATSGAFNFVLEVTNCTFCYVGRAINTTMQTSTLIRGNVFDVFYDIAVQNNYATGIDAPVTFNFNVGMRPVGISNEPDLTFGPHPDASIHLGTGTATTDWTFTYNGNRFFVGGARNRYIPVRFDNFKTAPSSGDSGHFFTGTFKGNVVQSPDAAGFFITQAKNCTVKNNTIVGMGSGSTGSATLTIGGTGVADIRTSGGGHTRIDNIAEGFIDNADLVTDTGNVTLGVNGATSAYSSNFSGSGSGGFAPLDLPALMASYASLSTGKGAIGTAVTWPTTVPGYDGTINV